MAFSQIKMTVSGVIIMEPVFKELDSGKKLLEVVISCRNGRKKKEGDQYEPANIYNITVWDNYASAMQETLIKGGRVTVFGHHVTETFELKEGGKGTKNAIDNAEFMQTDRDLSEQQPAAATTRATSTKKKATPVVEEEEIDDMEIPF